MKALRNFSVLIFFLIISIGYVHSQIPGVINYQAKLVDENGNALSDGVYSLTFTIFDAPIDGNAIWQENQDVPVKNGFINVYLGTNTAINIDFNKKLWLEVSIDGNEPFPRTPLSSVPYALNAKNSQIAQTVVDGAITTQKLAPGPDGDVLMTSGSNVVWAPLPNNTSWSLSGNSGTTAGTNFVGTTDNVPLEMRVVKSDSLNNILRLNTNGSIERGYQLRGMIYNPGNTRGSNAVDLQSYRTSQTQIASGDYSVISGGFTNSANSIGSTISGGSSNSAKGSFSTISGGSQNYSLGDYSTVGGGYLNSSAAYGTTIAGGKQNHAIGTSSTVSGGEQNHAKGKYSFVGGGNKNLADTIHAVICGGSSNWVTGINSVIAGGYLNNIKNTLSFIGSGYRNTSNALYSSIVCGRMNYVGGEGATIGGGATDTANGAYAAINGGRFNNALAMGSSIGGGWNNTASALFSTITGGYKTVADKYGQNAYASGSFNTNPPFGDAQTSVFVVRNKTTNSLTTVDLFLNGSNERMVLNNKDAWTFRAMVVGKSNTNLYRAAYIITGLITRNGSSTSIDGLSVQTIYETRANYNATAVASNNSLVIRVTGDVKTEMRWVARVEVAQLNY